MERTPALVSDTSHFKSSYASLYQQEAGWFSESPSTPLCKVEIIMVPCCWEQ